MAGVTSDPLREVRVLAERSARDTLRAERARADRDRVIREAVAAGHTLRAVAEAAGVTSALVHRIVHRGQ